MYVVSTAVSHVLAQCETKWLVCCVLFFAAKRAGVLMGTWGQPSRMTATHCNTHCNTLCNTHCNTLQHNTTMRIPFEWRWRPQCVPWLMNAWRGSWMCNVTHECVYLELTACLTLQHIATYCNTLQHAETRCNTLQHTLTHCNTLHHTAPHCSARPRRMAAHSLQGGLRLERCRPYLYLQKSGVL